jgi:hypothetical protein
MGPVSAASDPHTARHHHLRHPGASRGPGNQRALNSSFPFWERPRRAPEAPKNSKIGSVQISDVYVDEYQIVWLMDRFPGGLYDMEMTARANGPKSSLRWQLQ